MGAIGVGGGRPVGVGHLGPRLDGAPGPRVGVAGALVVAVVPVVADRPGTGCGGRGDGDELGAVGSGEFVGDEAVEL